jgi:hypothetical protein
MTLTGFSGSKQRLVLWILILTLAFCALVWIGFRILRAGQKEFTSANHRLLYGQITPACENVGNATVGTARSLSGIAPHWNSPEVLVFCDATLWQIQLEAMHRLYESPALYVLDRETNSIFFNAVAIERAQEPMQKAILEGFAALTLKSPTPEKIKHQVASWHRMASEDDSITILLVILAAFSSMGLPQRINGTT